MQPVLNASGPPSGSIVSRRVIAATYPKKGGVGERGTPIKTDQDKLITVVLEHPSDAHGVAASLTRKRSRGDGMRGFEKGALRYPDGGWR
jgi:hypothetical protein